MFLLVLSVYIRVLSGASSSNEKTSNTIDLFELYAGNLIYSNNQDGSCIACNGKCNRDNAVSPHSWTAVLEYVNYEGNIESEDLDRCRAYAADVAEFGVRAFTWNKVNHTCSLHVLEDTHDIATEMFLHNHFEWVHENPENKGPLFLVRYPSVPVDVAAVCYYGLNINNTPNIVRESNVVIIITVVIIIVSWNVWMNHTENYPPFLRQAHLPAESLEEEKNYIYTNDSKDE